MNATERQEAGAYKSILKASKCGIVEMVQPLTISCPDWNTTEASDKKGRNIFQRALLYRQEQVFNLIYDLPYKNMITNRRDKSGNNLLHIAGSAAPPSQHNQISGAALIMQRELQWFKEVEGLVPPKCKSERNNEHRTPRQVFTENHKKIVEAGEIWMKETSQASMVVAALIATVGFTSALTIPGGNYEVILPVFRNYWYFQLFILTDALSLLSSLSSTLMFLAILTSRFAEEDFHHSLPKKMILGLLTLFSSIVFMIISFSSALFLIFRHNSLNWLPLVSTVFIGGPIYLFVRLQISLLVEMISGTYGRSIFGKKKDMGIRRH
ncbi:hypothetical protein ACHQM5_002736 [Ranunculus cassubicifolius]